MRRPFDVTALPAALILAAAALLAWPAPARAHDPAFTDDFFLEECTWSWKGSNTFITLRPGHRLVLASEDEEVLVTNLRETKRITFTSAKGKKVTAIARVVEEREFEDDDLVEVSRNFFSRCEQTGDIYYFGEEVDDYEDGEIVGHGGAWLAGQNGALPGIILPGTFLIGARYFQEIAPGVALDRAENLEVDLDIATPAGTFHDCVSAVDSNALNPGSPGDVKVYCPGVGLVMDEDLVLQEIEFVKPGEE
jgi:hypothetical protein